MTRKTDKRQNPTAREAHRGSAATRRRAAKANDKAFKVGDLVRVKQSGGGLNSKPTPGPTLYMIDWIGERCQCCIREAGKPLAGAQEFDTSLLIKVPR